MKYTIILLGLVLLTSCKETSKEMEMEQVEEVAVQETTAADSTEKKPLSPHANTMAMIGDAHIHVDYSSPGVRNRIVFGGLLPYNAVWQAGAHNATWMETNKDLSIAGKELKAGKYGFFVIPNEKEWTVIFNSNWDQHGKDEYDETDDVLRFKVMPTVSEDVQEHLEYTVEKTSDTSGKISMSWEKVTIEFLFTVK
ncbi:DUF2911 domain-containing protein [Nonlabens sp. Ci31]|uniref:DUF2911 domain-containing protein n=1 Tax=Nonlabens sp. Ci31 TaxID=2608253 RepID=UPI0014636FAB|nr:DUF2911 domain-containing protein [Nonlabens sp. Ci31]QJP34762.1 DUF2911 domain-containing protein [Nonlabens sp. Ci31]